MKKKRKTRKHTPQAVPSLSPARQWAFRILAVLLPVCILVCIEAGLRIFQYGGNSALFISTPDESSVYYGINQDIGHRYFHSESFSPTPRKDLFLKKKPENGYRIFVLGGSTTAGFPYGNNLTFTRILHRRLSDTFPDRHIEVINTALTAVNTYTLLDFTDAIIRQQPDAVLIYAGHNEFYGALGVGSLESLGRIRSIVKISLKAQRLKTFMLLRKLYRKIRKGLFKKTEANPDADPMQTVMTRIVNQDMKIPYHSRLYQLGLNQFEHNLKDILNKLSKADIPVVLSELVSNISDHPPFESVNNDSLPAALSVYQQAQKMETDRRFGEARSAFYRAKDLDVLRFRAPEDFNKIIHHLSDAFQIPVVPMKSRFEQASPHGLIGNNLMHEHLHPNKSGYFLMADAFYTTMREYGLIQSGWPDKNIKPDSYYRKNWGFTDLDSTYAAMNILHLKGGWPFKKTGPNLTLQRFRPVTQEDSIVLNILRTGRLTLELGHIRLARYFEKTGNIDRAFEEYKALIYTVPNLDLFYEPAVELLLSAKQYGRMLDLLEDGLKYNRSFFMLKWTGQLHLAFNETDRGIQYLEKAAARMTSVDSQLLFNLARAYFKSGQFSKGNRILNRLRSMNPKSPLVVELENYRKQISAEGNQQ